MHSLVKWYLGGMTALLVLGALMTAPLARAQATGCDQTYIVTSGDWLGKIAEKFLGSAGAYNQIVEATNNAAKSDPSFAAITDPNVIAVGQKLCIPKAAGGVGAPAANATPGASGAITTTATVTSTGAVTGTAATPPAPVSALVGTYSAQLPAADASGRVLLLSLSAENKAVLATQFIGKGAPILESGTWQPEGKGARVLLTDSTGKIADNFLFEAQGDKLAATQYDKSLWGDAGLTVTRLAANSLAGVYRLTEPAADAPALIETLFLGPEGTAAFSYNYVDKLVRTDVGTWKTQGTGALIAFTQEDGKPMTLNVSVEPQGNQLNVVSGLPKITLWRLPATANITGTVAYAQKIGIPPESIVTVQLLDVSIPDRPGDLLAETRFESANVPLPIAFTLPYDPSTIAFNHTYAVHATIEVDGVVLFETTQNTAVLTNGAPTQVDLMLDKIR